MIGTILCVATMTLGVEWGLEKNDTGGLVYVVQINPTQFEHLKGGTPYFSDIPNELSGFENIQTIRFQVGEKKLSKVWIAPKNNPLPKQPVVAESPKAPLPINLGKTEPAKSPKELAPDLASKPIPKADTAGFEDPVDSASPPKSDAPKIDSQGTSEPEKPWPLLYATIALAIGFAAAFMYLAWLHIGMRSRYRLLLAEHLALTQPT